MESSARARHDYSRRHTMRGSRLSGDGVLGWRSRRDWERSYRAGTECRIEHERGHHVRCDAMADCLAESLSCREMTYLPQHALT
jgi:hypothetical protein